MPASISSDDLVRSLLRPEAYPWRPDRVELIETHISWVFLAGDRVVKIKRPVRYGFVDHTSAAQRRRSVEEEVRLNRRLTDGVYLGVAPITREGAGVAIDGPGAAIEWATLMRRLPAERMLDRLLASGSMPADLIDRLADRLIAFHREAAGPCDHPADALATVPATIVTSNLDELRPLAGALLGGTELALVDESMRAFVAEERSLLERRVVDGWVRDGHGDLRAEHVCLEENGAVHIFDCVEFSPAIRCADVASDLAFLLMDLDRLGAGQIATALEARYRTAGIELPAALVRFYRAHRALVRAKTACLAMGGGVQAHPGLAAEAAAYLHLAVRAALTIGPFLVAMTGLSGTGKSTAAAALAGATGARLISSDVVRKQLAGVAGSAAAEWGAGIYSPEWTERTYERLLEIAAEELTVGRAAVLDATFLDAGWRQRAADVARAAGAPFLLLETVCDEAVAVARIAARRDSPSDATVEIHRQQRRRFAAAPLPVPAGAIAVQIDTSPDSPIALDPALTALATAGAVTARIPADERAGSAAQARRTSTRSIPSSK